MGAERADAQPVINVPPTVVANGTVLPSGATVNVFEGGEVGLAVDLSGGTLNIQGGQVALGATGISTGFTNSGNLVNVSGGEVGPFFQLFSSTTLNLSGGTMDTFGVFAGSTANITGGVVLGFPDVFSAGVLNISGGNINSIRALSGSTVNLFGTGFSLDGSPVEGLVAGEATTITTRNATLTAVLADGSPFELFLRPFDPGFPSAPVALSSATITVTLVEVPCSDADLAEPLGVIDSQDKIAFLSLIAAEDAAADIAAPFSGVPDVFDLIAFLAVADAGCSVRQQ